MAWRTHDQLVAAIASGQTVSYGCGCPGVPFRTLTKAAEVPSQDQMTADEAVCTAAANTSVSALQAQLAALTQQVNAMSYTTAAVAQAAAVSAVAAAANSRTETQVKTAAYAMGLSDLIVPVDTTAGAFAVTLPPQPPNDTRCILVWRAGTSAPSFVAASGDTIPQGASIAVPGVGSSLVAEYDATTKTWTID